jgi:parvulin-like peptidyl-prolyl isomerase
MLRALSGPLFVICLFLVIALPAQAQSRKSSLPKAAPSRSGESAVLVVVNGDKITEADLQRMMQKTQVPLDARERYRKPYLEQLTNERLIRQFLAAKKITASKQAVDRQVQEVTQYIADQAAKRGTKPEALLAELGLSTDALREEAALSIAWKQYADQTLTSERINRYFASHRAEFDGTQVRARQIMLKVPSKEDKDFETAEEQLAKLRKQIVDGEISFEDAAREFSQSPSRERGGDLGFFRYSGKMPSTFAHHAFQLKTGEIGQPFRDTFGVHLCLITERRPGDLSLEDVRSEVLAKMSETLSKQTVDELRKDAKIEWKTGQ